MNSIPLHRHPRVPEEEDVEARNEHVIGVMAREVGFAVGSAVPVRVERRRDTSRVRSLDFARDERILFQRIRPAQRRERPQSELNQVSRTSSSWRSARPSPACARASASVSATKTLPSSSNHAGIRWPHHNCATDAPRLDILEPVEPGLLPGFGHDRDVARAHRLDRRLGQRRGIDIPLVGQPRFDHHARAVAVRGGDHPVLDLDQRALRVEQGDHRLARLEAVEADQVGGDQAVGGLRDAAPGIEHVEHLGGLEAGALADLEIVEVMARRDLDRARSEFGIGMFVGDDRDQPPVIGSLSCLPTSAA